MKLAESQTTAWPIIARLPSVGNPWLRAPVQDTQRIPDRAVVYFQAILTIRSSYTCIKAP